MPDLLYAIGTVAFFGVMLLYVTFCRRLGGADASQDEPHDA
jgi:hypothetical protein